eukprot:2565474-Amphidinium_carterae.1
MMKYGDGAPQKLAHKRQYYMRIVASPFAANVAQALARFSLSSEEGLSVRVYIAAAARYGRLGVI